MQLRQPRWLMLICAFSLSINASAQTTALEWDTQIIRGELENGLSYYAYPSADSNVPFNLRIVVNAGAVDEVQVKGVAHAVEHMVFNQSKAHPEGLHHYIRSLGWKTGKEINAKTQPSETHYMLRTRPNDALDLQQSLHLMADIVGGAQFNEAQWKIEQQIITEEKRLGESVIQRLSAQIKHSTKANSKYAQGSVIGSYQSIDAISFAELQAFYTRHYVASNMSLIISGHFDKNTLDEKINNAFAAMPKRPKPARPYLEYPLDDTIKLNKVQDRDGSTSKVAVGLRMAIANKGTAEGTRTRLENYVIRKLLRAQIRRNRVFLPEGINTFSGVLKDPSNERLVLAFASNTQDHDLGLKTIFTEMQRLRRDGFTEQQLQQVITEAKKIATRNIKASKQRDFAKWEDKITEAVVTQSVVPNEQKKAQHSLQLLNELTLTRINQRLTQMLNAPDMFIYYQAPAAVTLTLPTVAQVKALQAEIAATALPQSIHTETPNKTAVSNNTVAANAELPTPQGPVAIPAAIANKHYIGQDVLEWRLANGNRVVWLNRPTNDNKLYLKAITNIGYDNQQHPSWLAQSAVQLFTQLPAPGFSDTQWSQWQKQHDVQWQLKLQSQHLDFSLVTPQQQLPQALLAFWLQHQPRSFNAETLTALQESIAESYPLDAMHRINDHLYQQQTDNKAIINAASKVDTATLANTANALLGQQHTLFIVGELDQLQLQQLIGQYLAPLHNSTEMQQKITLQRSGQHHFTRQHKGNNKVRVALYGQTPMQWTPEDAFLLSTLNPVVQQALSQRLRLELGGVYRVAFEMKLDADSQHIDTELNFITSTARADELASASEAVLTTLQPTIDAINIERIREDIYFAEQNRLTAPSTWLRRLMLSYRAYDDPRYLSSMQEIHERVTRKMLQQMSQRALPMAQRVRIDTHYAPTH